MAIDLLDTDFIDSIASDVAIMTRNSLYREEEIFEAYGLSAEDCLLLTGSDYYRERLGYHSRRVSMDGAATLREQTKKMLEGSLRTLHEIANAPDGKPTDKMKAIALMMELSDMKPKAEIAQTGMVVSLNFGDTMGQVIASTQIVEHEPIRPTATAPTPVVSTVPTPPKIDYESD